MKQYKLQIIIVGIVLVLVVLMLISSALSKKQSISTPKPVTSESFTDVDVIPTLPPARGAGVDIESKVAQDSRQEIEKLYPALPFSKTITVGGKEVAIRIPEAELQDYKWSLIVYLPDLDFQAPTELPNYSLAKERFLAAASEVNLWIQQQGADPKKIIIVWGDTQFSQERAREWLK